MSTATKSVPQVKTSGSESEGRERPRRVRVRLTEQRRSLAARYVALARRVARPFKEAWPRYWEEFESAALYALVEAAESFDPDRGVRFGTYAYHRIRGSMRDARRELMSRGRFSSLGAGTVPEVQPALADQAGCVIGVEADPPIGWEIEGLEQIESWLRRLPVRWAEVCRLIYVHGKTQTEAAKALGMSQSRLSCVHRAALEMLHHDWAPRFGPQGGDRAAA